MANAINRYEKTIGFLRVKKRTLRGVLKFRFFEAEKI